jgi:hypothetical protein
MPRDNKLHQQMRSRIAAAAARIMAEDGLDNFSLAKRKAARQLGAEASHALPDNAEIEEALRTHQSLYQEDEQRARVRYLREEALKAMEVLAQFRPYLRGPVLKGTAARYGDVDIQLFADDSKEVELFLLNRGLRFEAGESRRPGSEHRGVPVFRLEIDDVMVKLAVHPLNDERVAPGGPGRAHHERASLPALRQLLQAELDQPPETSSDEQA